MGDSAPLIKQRNERAREELASDIDVLADRLNVRKQVDYKKQHIVESIKGRLGMATQVHGSVDAQHQHGALGTIRENKVASAMVAIGAAQLLRSIARHANFDMPATVAGGGDGVSAGAGEVMRRAAEVADQASVTASDAKDAVVERASTVSAVAGERAGEVVGSVRETVPTSRVEIEQAASGHLTAFGIGAFALGAIIGALAPKTRFEDEHLGDVREELVDTVQQRAIEAKDAVQTAAGEAKDTVKGAVGESLEHAERPAAAAQPGPGAAASRTGRITSSKGSTRDAGEVGLGNGSRLEV